MSIEVPSPEQIFQRNMSAQQQGIPVDWCIASQQLLQSHQAFVKAQGEAHQRELEVLREEIAALKDPAE